MSRKSRWTPRRLNVLVLPERPRQSQFVRRITRRGPVFPRRTRGYKCRPLTFRVTVSRLLIRPRWRLVTVRLIIITPELVVRL